MFSERTAKITLLLLCIGPQFTCILAVIWIFPFKKDVVKSRRRRIERESGQTYGTTSTIRSKKLTLQPRRSRDRYLIKTYRHMQNGKFCRNKGMTTLYKSNKETIRSLMNEEYFFSTCS